MWKIGEYECTSSGIWVGTEADCAKITDNIRDLADMEATDDSWTHMEF